MNNNCTTVEKVIKTTFKLRRGLLAEWNKVNPILFDGEPAFAIDVNILKIGDGVKHWSELDSINGSAMDIKIINGGTALGD